MRESEEGQKTRKERVYGDRKLRLKGKEKRANGRKWKKRGVKMEDKRERSDGVSKKFMVNWTEMKWGRMNKVS